ncbi:hypothetical protein CRPA25_62980 [Pseudomonas aeruginosa]
MPEPAPARTSWRPSGAATAWRCGSLREFSRRERSSFIAAFYRGGEKPGKPGRHSAQAGAASGLAAEKCSVCPGLGQPAPARLCSGHFKANHYKNKRL